MAEGGEGLAGAVQEGGERGVFIWSVPAARDLLRLFILLILQPNQSNSKPALTWGSTLALPPALTPAAAGGVATSSSVRSGSARRPQMSGSSSTPGKALRRTLKGGEGKRREPI